MYHNELSKSDFDEIDLYVKSLPKESTLDKYKYFLELLDSHNVEELIELTEYSRIASDDTDDWEEMNNEVYDYIQYRINDIKRGN